MKKIVNACLIICLTAILALGLCYTGGAKTEYSFDVSDISEDKIQQIWESVDIRLVDNSYYTVSPIVNFDVNNNLDVVVGLSDNTIKIFNCNNVILKTYKFDTQGSFYVKWNNGNLVLFLVRSSFIIEFSPDCELINAVSTDDTSSNNSVWYNLDKPHKTQINDNLYEMKNNMGVLNLFSFQTYSQLVRTDSRENTVLIYDVNSNQMIKIAVVLFVILAVLIIFILIVIISFINYRKKLKVNNGLK